ncbi:MAG TPA: flagellar basal-body rod protein FlgF [Bryobacteraceae bacterium]|nr:flagellar basal-body rod protein FlgF [Bryobacteraceae bacterium]
MDPLTAVAASGLRSRMESLEMLANNVANSTTGGFKCDREFYSLYVAPEADSSPASTMPVVERPWTDFSQGLLRSTGNPLDVALSGKGFFAVSGPSGALYTRDGSFRLAKSGQLVTAEGYPVRDTSGNSLTLQGTGTIQIAGDGTVTQDGAIVGQLQIADFTSTAGLVKHGSNYFQAGNPSVTPAAATGAAVEQGQLEGSNAGTSESAVRLISVMRQFEMLQKAVSLGAEMNRQAVEQVAKVGS